MALRKRALAALAAGALLVPFAPSSAFANHVNQRPINQACTSGVERDRFNDVDPEDQFAPFIDCIAEDFYNPPPPSDASAIATGFPGGGYGPLENVTRTQMAQFIYREALLAGARFDTETDPGYNDDNQLTGEAQDAVFALSNARFGPNNQRVLQGFPDGSFRPSASIQRDQMATYIVNITLFLNVSFATTTTNFFDDDNESVHEDNINRIAANGIARGQGPGDRTYGFRNPVLRQQMAVFLARLLDIFVDAERVNPVPENISVTPDNERVATSSQTLDFFATGLVPGQEYRIQLIAEGFATRGTNGEFTFTEAGTSNTAATGSPQSDITFVNGEAPENNTGEGTANSAFTGNTAVATADERGEITFIVTADPADDGFFAFVFRNGGQGNQQNQGGTRPELELNDDNTAAEPVDGSGINRPFRSSTTASGLQEF